jgi:hypothetical protein
MCLSGSSAVLRAFTILSCQCFKGFKGTDFLIHKLNVSVDAGLLGFDVIFICSLFNDACSVTQTMQRQMRG